MWLLLDKDNAIDRLHRYRELKGENPQGVSALITLPTSLSRNPKVRFMLKGMQVAQQLHRGQVWDEDGQKFVPWSIIQYYDKSKAQVSLASILLNPGLEMQLQGRLAGKDLRILVDTGATHSFITKEAAPKQDGKEASEIKGGTFEMASGATGSIQGTVKARLRVDRMHCHQELYIVEQILQGVDCILGNDWCKEHKAVLDYGTGLCRVKDKNGSLALYPVRTEICNDLPKVTGIPTSCPGEQQRPGKDKVIISAMQLKRLIRKGCPTAMTIVRSCEDDYPGDEQSEGSGKQSAEAVGMCKEFADVFPEVLPTGLPLERSAVHTIDLQDGARPAFRPGYRLTRQETEEAKTQVQQYLQAGVIRPSASPFGSPILFVKKKDDTLRMVIDYRAVNKMTIKERYPLPRIDDLLDRPHGSEWFTGLDLMSGYHQIRLHEPDIPKTAFRTPTGHYEFTVLPFGLSNAPSTFQRIMNDTLHEFIEEGFVVVYLDDVLIHSKTLQEHKVHVHRVLSRLREEKFYAKLPKCALFQRKLTYLGHTVSREGLQVDPNKVKAIQDWKVPSNVHEVRSFLGLASYFRKFIKDFASTAGPLTDLTKKDAIWNWTGKVQDAFDNIKRALTSAPVLRLPDNTKPFTLICDASGTGIGAILMQEENPVAFESRKLTQAEQHYTVTEQELLSVVHALRIFRCYCLGNPTRVVTDHKANTFLQEQKTLSSRQARWSTFLQDYDLTWEYKPGAKNIADPLSRKVMACVVLILTRGRSCQEVAAPQDVLSQETARRQTGAADPFVDTIGTAERDALLSSVQEGYKEDPWFQERRNRKKLKEEEGYWWKAGKDQDALVIPKVYKAGQEDKDLKLKIVSIFHDPPHAGHKGIQGTAQAIQRHYWWPGLIATVEDYISSCDLCQRNKVSTLAPAGMLKPLRIPARKWECASMDFITQLPRTKAGHDAILVVVDRLTKLAHFMPTTSDVDAKGTAELFDREIFRLHGMPEEILTDRGTQFTSQFSQELFRLRGCSWLLSTAYHPQTDGQTERINRILEDTLRHYISPRQDDWDEHLPHVEFSYNNAYQESIATSPFMLTYGVHPRVPGQVAPVENQADRFPGVHAFKRQVGKRLELAKECIAKAQARQETYYNQHRREAEFQVGQEVLLSTAHVRIASPGTPKLLSKYIGPFKVQARQGTLAYRLELPDHYRIHPVFHVSLLKAYKAAPHRKPPPPPDIIGDEEEFEVEDILQHRQKGGKTSYLVKWTGYGQEYNSWEPEDCFAHAHDTIREYWARRSSKQKGTQGIKRQLETSRDSRGLGRAPRKRSRANTSQVPSGD